MPLPWNDMTFRQHAENAIENVGGLDEQEIADVYEEWGTRTYPDCLDGRWEALSDLQQIALGKLHTKLGITVRYNDATLQRLNKGLQDNDSTNS
jgi:hypothetical protein